MRTLRIALAQVNTTVGDFGGNLRRIKDAIARAEALGAELIAFPEQTIPGYPAEDLLLRSEFIDANRRALAALAGDVTRSVVVVGLAHRDDDVYNAAAVIAGGEVRGIYRKHHLPNYSVFDEKRYFQAGREPLVFGYGRRHLRRQRVRGHVVPRRARRGAGRRGRRGAAARPLLLAVLPRQDRAIASACWPRGPRTTWPASPSSTRWAARTSWSSTAAR